MRCEDEAEEGHGARSPPACPRAGCVWGGGKSPLPPGGPLAGVAPARPRPLGESALPALRLLKTSLGERGAAVRRRGTRGGQVTARR